MIKNIHKKIHTKRGGVSITGIVTIIGTDSQTGKELSRSVTRNMVMQGDGTGLDLVIQRLVGTNTYSLNINYGEIGTGSTAVALSDIANAVAVARTPVVFSQDFGQTQAILQFFFPDSSLINQTYAEFATFVDGGAGLNTGRIFNHALFGTPYVKNSGQDTTVQVVFTLSQ